MICTDGDLYGIAGIGTMPIVKFRGEGLMPHSRPGFRILPVGVVVLPELVFSALGILDFEAVEGRDVTLLREVEDHAKGIVD